MDVCHHSMIYFDITKTGFFFNFHFATIAILKANDPSRNFPNKTDKTVA